MGNQNQERTQGKGPQEGPPREIASDAHLESRAIMDRLHREAEARIAAGRRGNEIGAKP